ncbi:MAG TPA: DUF4491 family protein [Rectinemataceae bacterium]|nr:DUF4491 family protein [Rectinemataceae bacterium]
MAMETAGLAAAAATFLSVWLGHVAVRFLEYRVARLWMARALFGVAGAACVAASLACSCPNGSVEFGIFGLVFLFDILELGRQEGRVREGRARANPDNPRHRPVFASGKALSADLFDREPAPPAYRRGASRSGGGEGS